MNNVEESVVNRVNCLKDDAFFLGGKDTELFIGEINAVIKEVPEPTQQEGRK